MTDENSHSYPNKKQTKLKNEWKPNSWRNFPIQQQPNWPNNKHLHQIIEDGKFVYKYI